eukprot:c14487_g1_i1 orf=199-1092(-)
MLRWKGHEATSSAKTHVSDEEEAKVDELNTSLGTLLGRRQKFCSVGCLRRYLRARNWDVQKSKKMLEETLSWRAAYKPEELRWTDVAEEGETGKVYRADFFDKKGRTVLVLVPANQNTSSCEGQLRHLVYLMENALFNLPADQEQMVWLIDFTGWSFSTAVPVKTTREVVNVLQNHYPERLGNAILYNPPRIFGTFWKVVKHFLDRKTHQKVQFVYSTNPESFKFMEELFDVDQLTTAFGGKRTEFYDHEKNSKQMQEDDVKSAAFWQLNDEKHLENGKEACDGNGFDSELKVSDKM